VSYNHILFEVDTAGIAVATVNRPEKRNALSSAVVAELDDVFTRIAGDSGIRAAILTGAGEKAFVAGADISELAGLSPAGARQYAETGQRAFRKLETSGKPSVAAVSGFALGGGLELAMAATVRFASPNALLGQPEVRLGLIPGYGGTQRLARLIGRGRALELLLSGEPVAAEEAYRLGLVNRVVPQSELLDYSRAWLRKVLANSPVAVRLVMDAVDRGLSLGFEEALAVESRAFEASAESDAFREGTRAFLEKRNPAFAGN
jgi:enoyl-CoA hydratase